MVETKGADETRPLLCTISGEAAIGIMEQSEEIARLLTEIRDLQREHFAEYKRVTEDWDRANKAAAEKAEAQYKLAVESNQAFTWAMWILIAVCLGANLFMMVRVSALR